MLGEIRYSNKIVGVLLEMAVFRHPREVRSKSKHERQAASRLESSYLQAVHPDLKMLAADVALVDFPLAQKGIKIAESCLVLKAGLWFSTCRKRGQKLFRP